MEMTETTMTKILNADCNAPRPAILHTRRFRRSEKYGMLVWRSVTKNVDSGTEIEHIEIECPQYELTGRGPVLKKKKKEDE